METSPHEIWLDLYPVGGEEKKKFLTLLNAIHTGSIIFTIIFVLATKRFHNDGFY